MDAATAGLLGAGIGAFLGLAGTTVDRLLGGRRANLEWLRQLQLPNYRKLVLDTDGLASSVRSMSDQIAALLRAVAAWIETTPRTFPFQPDLAYSEFRHELEIRVEQLDKEAAAFRMETSAFSLVTSQEARARLSSLLQIWSFWLENAEIMFSKAPPSEPVPPPGWTENLWTDSSPEDVVMRYRQAANHWEAASADIGKALAEIRGKLLRALRADLGVERVRWWQRERRVKQAEEDEVLLMKQLGSSGEASADLPEQAAPIDPVGLH